MVCDRVGRQQPRFVSARPEIDRDIFNALSGTDAEDTAAIRNT